MVAFPNPENSMKPAPLSMATEILATDRFPRDAHRVILEKPSLYI